MSTQDALTVAQWRLETITQIVENFLTVSGEQKDPSLWAMNTLGQIIAILDITNDEVLERINGEP